MGNTQGESLRANLRRVRGGAGVLQVCNKITQALLVTHGRDAGLLEVLAAQHARGEENVEAIL